MNNRTKEFILKILIVIGLSSLALFAIIGPILSFFIKEEYIVFFEYIAIAVFLTSGVIFIILLIAFGEIKQKPIKAEKIELPFSDFNELFSCFIDSAKQEGYSLLPSSMNSEHGIMSLFIRSRKFYTLDCIVLIKTSELTKEFLQEANDNITESLMSYYNKLITDTISMITIVCVDRITPTFQRLVNSNIQQGLKNFRLHIGISFGGKKIYISKQNDGFAITKYKKLRKEFFKIMQLDIKNKQNQLS